MYTIEKNIPVKPIIRNGVEVNKYPFVKMAVGDSFAVPVDPATALGYVRVRARVSQAVCDHRKRNGSMLFTTRTDKVHNCIRVWRIA